MFDDLGEEFVKKRFAVSIYPTMGFTFEADGAASGDKLYFLNDAEKTWEAIGRGWYVDGRENIVIDRREVTDKYVIFTIADDHYPLPDGGRFDIT